MDITQLIYIKVMLAKLVSLPLIKVLTALLILAGGFFFDHMLNDAIIALLVLMVFDFATALFAAYKAGEPIYSSKVLRTAIKIAVYMLLVSSGHLAETGIGVDYFPLNAIDETILGFLVITELISIIENTGKMGYAIPKKLLNRLNEYKNDL